MNATRSGMPSYNVPPTQNTALVLEFRCLYTHDILKKQKKWHDGSLKFHTFNRRVMVYDDVKNYIGDLHYRRDEEFGEGLELQLDRPVMVEVGEPIGQSSTDLRPILERGRADRNSTIEPAAAERLIQRVNSANTTGKVKSLLEVLGPSQGRIGRAKLSFQSPYDQRVASLQEQQGQPPPKRLKTTTGKENVPLVSFPVQPDLSDPHAKSKTDQPGTSRRPTRSKPKQASRDAIVIDVSSDDGLAVEARLNNRAGLTPSSPRHSKNTGFNSQCPNEAGISESTASREQITTARKGSQRKLKGTGKSTRKASKIQVEKDSSSSSRHASPKLGDLQQASMTTLKLRTRPTRRKLMYKALLPSFSGSSAFGTHSRKDSVENLPSHTISGAVKQVSAAHNVASKASLDNDDTRESNNDVEETMPSCQADQRPEYDETIHMKGRQACPQSPLFCTQSASQLSASSPHVHVSDDDLGFLQNKTLFQDQHTETPTEDASNQILVISSSEPELEDVFSDDEQQFRSNHPKDLGKNDPRTASPVSSVVVEPLAPGKELTPCFQEDRSNSLCASKISPEPIASIDSTRSSMDSEKSKSAQGPTDPTVASLRSHSLIQEDTEVPNQCQTGNAQNDTETNPADPVPDTVAANEDPQHEQPAAENAAGSVAGDTGAWSKLEAFLLFDKWPDAKAKDKPVYIRKPPLPKANATTAQPQAPAAESDYDGIGLDEQIILSIDAVNRPLNTKKTRSYGLHRGFVAPGPNKGRTTPLSRLMPGVRSAKSIMRDSTGSLDPLGHVVR